MRRGLLLDTCVLAEFSKPAPDQRVVAFVQSHRSEPLFLSVISVGEISKGLCLLSDSKRKEDLQEWLFSIENTYKNHTLSITAEIAKTWGVITAEARQRGRVLPAADGLIAATAIEHGLHVVTRNIKDFECSAALLINPWDD
jgi:predicted nucleic acid-binding protein